MPRYLAVLAYGSFVPLMKIGCCLILLFVKSICTDLDLLSFIRYGDSFIYIYVDVRTPQKTHIWAYMTGYGDSFNFLYADDVPTPQEAHLWTSTVCYGDSFNFLYRHDIYTQLETYL
jgi:hypothetical protein